MVAVGNDRCSGCKRTTMTSTISATQASGAKRLALLTVVQQPLSQTIESAIMFSGGLAYHRRAEVLGSGVKGQTCLSCGEPNHDRFRVNHREISRSKFTHSWFSCLTPQVMLTWALRWANPAKADIPPTLWIKWPWIKAHGIFCWTSKTCDCCGCSSAKNGSPKL